jgi:hypothetical protein
MNDYDIPMDGTDTGPAVTIREVRTHNIYPSLLY